jgi:cytosine/adenosine deaminase-related metal-dependent hydrolase
MANIGAYGQNLMLNFVNNAVAATRPTSWFAGLSLGSPTSAVGSEMANNSGYTRQSALIAGATDGTCSNSVAMTFGPVSTAYAISGIQIWDTQGSTNTGNMMWFGLLSVARTLASGDSLVIAVGALTFTLS